jgi:hypothetical protein
MQSEFFKQATKKAKVTYVKGKLATDNRWLLRGLLAIYHKQTAAEQALRQTTVSNKVGFTAYDAEFLSGMTKLVEEQRALSAKQLDTVRNKMVKYAGQLVEIAIHKGGSK